MGAGRSFEVHAVVVYLFPHFFDKLPEAKFSPPLCLFELRKGDAKIYQTHQIRQIVIVSNAFVFQVCHYVASMVQKALEELDQEIMRERFVILEEVGA